MESKNPKSLNVFYFLYVFGFFYLIHLFNLEYREYKTDKGEWFKLFFGLFWLSIFALIYGYIFIFFNLFVFKYFDAAIFKHFDAAIKKLEKAWPDALLIIILAFMLYIAIFLFI